MVLALLDRGRSEILKRTMVYPWVRRLYRKRATRIGLHFLVVYVSALFLAEKFPLWLLALGPALYGYPHLLASARYLTSASSHQRSSGTLVFLVVTATLLVAVAHSTSSFFSSNNFIELIGLVVCFLAMARLQQLSFLQKVKPLVLILPLIYFSMTAAVVVAGLIILAHNFIGFFYWIRQSHDRSEKWVAWLALGFFATAHIFIFWGPAFAFNWELLGLKVWALGHQIFPEAGINPALWGRAVVAYAFGQSLHYFVWLRAIPEQELAHATPSSFRQSLYSFYRDWGTLGARLALGLALSASAVWFLVEFQTARLIYLSVAAFHGYAELAGLLLPNRRKAAL